MKFFLDKLIKINKIIIDNSEKNINNLREAYLFAKNNSTDKSSWTGAIIVNEDKIVSYGTNRFAVGVKHTKARMERPKKYLCQEHAERNAICLAAKNGIKTDKTMMCMPWSPCPACANAIITSGIQTLVMHYNKCIKTPVDWIDDLKEGILMLLEAKVQIIIVTSEIGDCKSKFRGEFWYP